ncbi:cytochrome P450 [Brunnivagina elsteri]|uniref:cytochrome P450 n=1 Tax=Brunnivagina elsteri TaxID=1247191 RepID=UPI001FE8B293|nr:cytochrome P450 [Calothrix elsteri]
MGREIGQRKTGNVVDEYSLPLNSPTPPILHSPTPLQPGEYVMTMGIGNKTDAYYGITSTGAQFWNSFPNGVKNDVLPLLEKRLEELRDIADDPRKIAQDYVNTMDARFKHQMQSLMANQDLIDFDNLDLGDIENQIDEMFSSSYSEHSLIYRILRADLEGHYQLLEHPKIIDKLQEYLREQYMDCATGRFIKFDSAMAQTCHDLAANEVCYPKFPDGAELIVYRGPTANSNTVDVYINRHLPNEPHDRNNSQFAIRNSQLNKVREQNAKCLFWSVKNEQHQLPACLNKLQVSNVLIANCEPRIANCNDIGTIKLSPQGLKHSLSDCDGDRMALAQASEFSHTAVEIKQKQLPENRYSEIIKPEKQAYTGSFEQIALDAMENKIGLVANLCMKGIALENECVSIPDEEAGKFLRDISCAAVEMLKAENQSFASIKYSDNLRSHIVELAQLCPQPHQEQNQYSIIPQFDIREILERIGKFYHDVVGTLGGQLQI